MLEIFQYDFMLRAFAAGLMAAVIAPVIGIFLVVRRYSHLADALSHVALLGVALGVLLGVNPFLTAVLVAVVSAFGLERLRGVRGLEGDSLLALWLFGSLALAVVLISLVKGFSVDLFSFLFGSITTVTASDLWMVLIFGAVVILLMAVFYKEFFLVSLDEELAESDGLPTRFLNTVIIALAALTVSLSMRIIGVLLIGALMIIPVITAFQFRVSFKKTILLAVIFSMTAVIIGLFLSFYYDLATGGTIVVLTLLFFFTSAIWNRRK